MTLKIYSILHIYLFACFSTKYNKKRNYFALKIRILYNFTCVSFFLLLFLLQKCMNAMYINKKVCNSKQDMIANNYIFNELAHQSISLPSYLLLRKVTN